MRLSIQILLVFLLSTAMLGSSTVPTVALETNNKPKKKKLKEMLKGGFADFFNITEKGRVQEQGRVKIHYKTGGFKEHIDIYIWINKKKEIVVARLEISRTWLQESLAFGLDVEKSFVKEFATDKKYIEPLVDKLWGLARSKEEENLSDKELQTVYDVVIGKKMNYEFKHTDKQTIHFSNVKIEEKKGHILITEFRS